MENQFFERPILNSPYAYPARHWELDENGQPPQQILASRRGADFVTPIPKPRKRKGDGGQGDLALGDEVGTPTPAKSAATAPTASPAGSSTPTTTKDPSSSATPTSSAPATPTNPSRPP